MEFEWDEDKRLTNLAKHRLDFRDAPVIFRSAHIIVPSRQDRGEARLLATARVHGQFVTVVYTMRGGRCRIISMRSARNVEQTKYRELHGRTA